MPFACQNDSYLRAFTASIEHVSPGKCKIPNEKGKVEVIEGYEVILNDTVLFPEGGGQPDDRGTMNGVPVLRVTRKGAEAIHFITTPVSIGDSVDLAVDWGRRFDHMQQHSGQHLITAIVDKKYGFATTSWDLGKTVSFIELDTPSLSLEQMKEVETECNNLIRVGTEVIVHVTEVGSDLLKNVRARGLPEDHVGAVRIVEIKGVDSNMCCGTHVKTLSDLLCVKLLSAEKGKKGKTNLYFLVGNRVLDYVENRYCDDKALTKLLKCGPSQHVEAVDRSIKQLKQAQKTSMTLLRNVATLEAKCYFDEVKATKYLRLHRKEGNNEYMNIVANEYESVECTLFLTVGDEKGEGLYLICSTEKILDKICKPVCDIINGKGFVKGGRMQGKATNLKECNKAEDIIRSIMQDLGTD